MFLRGKLRIHGTAGAILYGWHQAAVIRAWRIGQADDGAWHLTAALERVDAFQCRQRPLLFTAPRAHTRDGFWAWSVQTLDIVGLELRATLGAPEQ